MLSTIESINSVINNFIWGLPAMICIIGVGIVLSVKTRFIQIRKFPYAMKITIGRMLKKRKASDGALTPFQAVCTALAATVGTGNIAGVAGAIAIGGPGAVFWMWISAILGMCTKFSEVVLAVHFRETNNNGELVGGPMYYIKNGLNKHWHWLAYLFSALGVLTVFGTGNATQVNTITAALDSALINYNIISDLKKLHGYQPYLEMKKTFSGLDWYEKAQRGLRQKYKEDPKSVKSNKENQLKFITWTVDINDSIDEKVVKENVKSLIKYADEIRNYLDQE